MDLESKIKEAITKEVYQDFLRPLGFQIQEVHDGLGFTLTKESNEKKEEVNIYLLKRGQSFSSSGFGAAITFKELENIIYPIFKKNDLIGDPTGQGILPTLILNFNKNSPFKTGLSIDFQTRHLPAEIRRDSDIHDYITHFKVFVKQIAFKFFTDFGSLSDLKNVIVNKKGIELHHILPVGPVFKKAAILFLEDDCFKEEFLNHSLERYRIKSEAHPNEVSYTRGLEILKDLKLLFGISPDKSRGEV